MTSSRRAKILAEREPPSPRVFEKTPATRGLGGSRSFGCRIWISCVSLLVMGLDSRAQPFPASDVFTLKCKANNRYVTVQAASGLHLAANRTNIGALQLFSILNGGSGSYALKARVNGR